MSRYKHAIGEYGRSLCNRVPWSAVHTAAALDGPITCKGCLAKLPPRDAAVGMQVLTVPALEVQLEVEVDSVHAVDARTTLARYMWERVTTDGDAAWLMGPGTQVAYLLCQALAELDGRPLEDVERDLRKATPGPRTLFAKGEPR